MDPDRFVVTAQLVSGGSVANAPFWFWWLLPVVTTVVVLAAVRWSRRDRRPADSHRSVAEYARFRAAFGAPQDDDDRSGAR